MRCLISLGPVREVEPCDMLLALRKSKSVRVIKGKGQILQMDMCSLLCSSSASIGVFTSSHFREEFFQRKTTTAGNLLFLLGRLRRRSKTENPTTTYNNPSLYIGPTSYIHL